MKNTKTKNTFIAMGLIVGTLLSGATEVEAYVNPATIKIDQQNDDTIARKLTEANIVEDSFTSSIYNEIDIDTVSHAIELSDVLNSYYPSPNEYSNTTVKEIINVDINDIYNEYESIDHTNDSAVASFCQGHLGDLAAIDGFTVCSQRAVSSEIIRALTDKIDDNFSIKGHPDLTKEPEVVIDPIAMDNGEQPFIIYNYETQLIKVMLSGTGMREIADAYIETNNEYQYLKAFLNGSADEFSASFAEQGVDANREWTVFLSSGNDNRKEMLKEGIEVINKIKNGEYPIEMDFTPYNEPVDDATKDYLLSHGYNQQLVANSGVIGAYVDSPTLQKTR